MKNVGIVAFDEMETLDFAGPFEVFTTANRVAFRDRSAEPFRVRSMGTNLEVRMRAGVHIKVDHDIRDIDSLDILIIPGGITFEAEKDERLINWIREISPEAEIVASVCTGAFILATAGVIASGPITTHWEDVDDLRKRFPALDVQTGVRWVDQGRIVTSAGISAGIDMCLHLVEKIVDRELAERTARQMDYFWTE